ncbi:hypothetical protein BIY21_18970 [Vibrio ponticus]|uniref:Diguanylate cyclase n=1 Tax=Vibrio ponticus TaxID=265668 RepID=A0ABX3FAK2_9VIBR|nr:diguanylate cyclase [Vibrio ponticus]OLQ85664.1 hypothetical protein BIY21_18970 [Vibrio ponticus]
MKTLSSYIISVFLTLTTVPIALFGGTYIIYDLYHQHQSQTARYEQVIAQQLLDAHVALTQFDLLQAELVTTEIAQLDYIISAKLDSMEYGITLAEVINPINAQGDLTTFVYPINNLQHKQIGLLTVDKDKTALIWDIAKSTVPKVFSLGLILLAVSLTFTRTILAALNKPFTELQKVAFQIANGDYHTPSKTDSKFLEITTIFSALDAMRAQLKSTISLLRDSQEKHARTYNLTQVGLFVVNIKKRKIVRANSTLSNIFKPFTEQQKQSALEAFLPKLLQEPHTNSFNYSISIEGKTRYFQINRSQVINDEIECSGLDISELMQAKLTTERMLNTDALTQVPNRHRFNLDVLAIEEQSNPEVTIMVLDLNGFKAVNDTFGHLAGDQVLINIAQRVTAMLANQSATLYRLGGDEFVILVNQPYHAEHVTQLVDNIRATIALPIEFEHNQFAVATSIGIAHYNRHSTDLQITIKQADKAMYHAKTTGLNVAYAAHLIDQTALEHNPLATV